MSCPSNIGSEALIGNLLQFALDKWQLIETIMPEKTDSTNIWKQVCILLSNYAKSFKGLTCYSSDVIRPSPRPMWVQELSHVASLCLFTIYDPPGEGSYHLRV